MGAQIFYLTILQIFIEGGMCTAIVVVCKKELVKNNVVPLGDGFTNLLSKPENKQKSSEYESDLLQ